MSFNHTACYVFVEPFLDCVFTHGISTITESTFLIYFSNKNKENTATFTGFNWIMIEF